MTPVDANYSVSYGYDDVTGRFESVTADVADEVHFHGYDLYGDVAPGQPAIIKVEALIPGVFEVELEGSRLELVLIEVK